MNTKTISDDKAREAALTLQNYCQQDSHWDCDGCVFDKCGVCVLAIGRPKNWIIGYANS